MKAWHSTKVLSETEREQIHESVCQVLQEIGIKIESKDLLEILDEFGYPVDYYKEVVYFPKKIVEEYMGNAGGKKRTKSEIRFNAGGYPARYIDLETDEVKHHTFLSSSNFNKVADALENIDTMNCLGIPSDVSPQTQPFYKKLLSWINTSKPYLSGEITSVKELPCYIELCQQYCEYTGKKMKDVANVNVHKDYPLFLDRAKAELILEALKEGLSTGVGSGIASVGGTAPVTLAGALVIQLVDQFSCNLINRAIYKRSDYVDLSLFFNLGVIDMRNGLNCTSRPEASLLILAMGDMADFYGAVSLSIGFGKTQAKTIASVQSGVERLSDFLTGVYAGATRFGSLGIISEPEGINSVAQLVIDNEIAGILKRIAKGFLVNEETLAVEVIKDAGYKPVFLSHPHTARHFRDELWLPEIFIGGVGYDRWLEEGAKTEIDKAKEKAREILETHHPEGIDNSLIEKLLNVIKKWEDKL